MQSIQQVLTGIPEVKKWRSQRAELIGFFHEKLQKQYKYHTKKELKLSTLAFRLSHLKVVDLYYMKSACLDAERRGGSFSKCFWGSLKVK